MSADNWAPCPKCATDDPKYQFREDYEIGVDEVGEFFISYRGRCKDCGFEHKFEHRADLSEGPTP